MKKMADIMSKTGKWLLVFGFIFIIVLKISGGS